MSVLKHLAAALLLGAMTWGVLLIGIDALEFETTGKCQDCLVLNKIRDL